MGSMLITIDGHAGAGKGTIARHLAEIYRLAHLDTGVLYRAVGLKVIEAKEELTNVGAAVAAAQSLSPVDFQRSELRDEEVGYAASIVATFKEVREILLAFQRSFADHPSPGMQGVVMDGRDIGLVVLPQAPCKIFVTASVEVRAERRLKELHQKGIDCIYEAVFADIKARDERDETRKVSPLRPAEGAYVLDTSTLTIDECIEKVCAYVDSLYPEARKYI